MESNSTSKYLTEEDIKDLQQLLTKNPIDPAYNDECELFDSPAPMEQQAARWAYRILKKINRLPDGMN